MKRVALTRMSVEQLKRELEFTRATKQHAWYSDYAWYKRELRREYRILRLLMAQGVKV